MSRVGRKIINVPSGVKIRLEERTLKVEAKGKSLEHTIPYGFVLEIGDKTVEVKRPSDSRTDRAMHGTTRSLIQNMVIGLTAGFEKSLEIQGVGYKAKMKGKVLVLEIGKSHPVEFAPNEGITIETPAPTKIVVKGMDKQQVGEASAEIRAIHPPEPYKGKGIRYEGEYVRRKQGKSIA